MINRRTKAIPETPAPRDAASVKRATRGEAIAYRTRFGTSVVGLSEEVLERAKRKLAGKVQLVFTSPPFPLTRKKRYDNLQGQEYVEWLASYGPLLTPLLTPTGAIIIEVGNAWEPGEPVMSTLPLESLFAFKGRAGLKLCQEFIWHNPAKLPTPAQWVTIERIRVKDSFTRLWWMSPTGRPKADNRRVLTAYSASMTRLLDRQRYNSGSRPSEHQINSKSFLANNGGAIPPSFLSMPVEDDRTPDAAVIGSNTRNNDPYSVYCRRNGLSPHPARMPLDLADFFIKLCTDPGDLILDPFAGSNTTGQAAETAGRHWLAIEANATYAQAGISRFSHARQGP